jgi:hypothetical protein
VTYQDIESNYGRDVEELFEQHEREDKLAEQYGVKTAFQPFGMKMPVDADVQGSDDAEPRLGMKEDAQRGLDWRREFGRGGTEVGIARARDIVNGKNLSDSTVKRMYSFFSRHEVDKKGKGFNQGEEGYPSNGRIAWALWGGDAGFSWSKRLVEQMKNDDRSSDKGLIDK